MLRKIMPTTYFLAMLLLSIGLHFIFPIMRFIHPPYSYLGLILILFGVAINLWTDSMLKKGNTPVKPFLMPTSLLTEGPFRISRHPMYLGMVAVLLGTVVIHGSLVGLSIPVFFVILMEILFIHAEEENLVKVFGQQYFDYKKKVRRWF